jgi:hypothetical protein
MLRYYTLDPSGRVEKPRQSVWQAGEMRLHTAKPTIPRNRMASAPFPFPGMRQQGLPRGQVVPDAYLGHRSSFAASMRLHISRGIQGETKGTSGT